MKPNPTNIFGRMTQPENQPRTNMFDKLHSNKPSENLFNKMSPPNNNDQKSESKNIFKMSKMPATNIFSANVNPVNTSPPTSVVTQNINIFAMESKTQQVKDVEVKKPIISVSDFSTPQKNTQIPGRDQYQTPEEKSKPQILEKQSQQKAVKKQKTKKVLQIKLQQQIVDNFSPQSPISNQMNSPSNSSSTKRLQFFPRSSSSRKTERQGSGQKSSQQSVSNLSAFSSKQYENSASEQFRSFQQRNQSKTSSIYTFQKRSGSKKLSNNGQQSIEDYQILDNQGTFSFQQKFSTPKRGEEKQVHIKDEKILSTIKEIEGQESPFHRIELSDTMNKLSKASSSPPYMNDTLKSPSLSYMDDNGSSLKTSQKNIGNQIFLGFQVQQRQKQHSNEIFQHVQLHSITKSQNNISTQNLFKQTQSKEQAQKKSFPKIQQAIQQPFVEEKNQTKKQEKKVVKLKDFLQMHSASKSPQNQFQKIQIKRTQSESDSQSHSFSSRDLGASRNLQTKSIKSPFGQPTGKLSALNKRSAQSTTAAANIQTKSKSAQRLIDQQILEQKKQQKSPIALFNQVKQPVFSSPQSKKEQEKKSEDDVSSLEKTISLDYSDTTQKIQSSTNTLCIKSLLTKSQQKMQVKRQEERQKIIEILGQQKPQQEQKKQKKEINQSDNNDDNDQVFQIPQRLQQRKITFGKTLEIQSQFKIVAESIKEQSKLQIKSYKNVHLVQQQKQKQQKQKPSSQEQNKPFPKQQNKLKSQRYITKVSSKPQLSSSSKQRQRTKKQQSSKRQTSPKRQSSTKKDSSSQKRQPSPKIRQSSSNNKKSTKQSSSQKYEKQRYNLHLIKNELCQAKLRNSSTILPYKNVLKTFQCHKMQFQLRDLLDIHQKGAKKLLQITDSAFRISNYLRLYKKLFANTLEQNETKFFDSIQSKAKKLQTSLNTQQKWFNKIKEITKRYDLQLQQQKKQIQLKKQQQNQKKSRSFFDIFNIKKNRFFVQTNLEKNRNAVNQNGKSEFFRAKSSMILSFKEILDILKRKSQICHQKTKFILDKSIKHQEPRLLSLNVIKKTSKQPKKSKLMQILAMKAAAKDEQNKVQKNIKYSSLFEEKQLISLSSRYEKSIFHKDMVQNFLNNLSKGSTQYQQLQQRTQHILQLKKLHQQANEKQKQEWLRQMEHNQKLTQIKNYHQNSYKAYKNIKKIFDNKFFNNNNNKNINNDDDDRLIITIEDRYRNKLRQRQQNIINKKQLNREMNKKMGDNVSIKLKNVNFKTQVFML